MLRKSAIAASYEPTSPYYPGVRSAADYAYLGECLPTLRSIFSDVFGFRGGANLIACDFSIVTTPPDQLGVIQRLPHFDTTNPNRLALLHYLSNGDDGGTGFYRHIATGFETVSPDRFDQYKNLLDQEVIEDGLPPPRYFRGDHPRFDRIGHVNAVYNRMAIYRSFRLHSGDIPDDLPLHADPAKARLTLNTFIDGY